MDGDTAKQNIKKDDVTAELVTAIQREHKRNLNLSAVTIAERLNLSISPATVVRVIEGHYNHLLEMKR